MGEIAGNLHHAAGAALVSRGCRADTTCEKITEAAQAGETHFHTDFGDGVLTVGQKKFGPVEARLDSKLVRRETEQGFKLADEVERRDAGLLGDGFDREGLFGDRAQQLSRLAKPVKNIVPEQHRETSV